MENEVSNEYIQNAITELHKSSGVKEPISGEVICRTIREGELQVAMQSICRQLGLPVVIQMTNVPNDYRKQNTSAQFHSTHAARTNPHGSGGEGIVAQVHIPSSLPLYGSSALTDYTIQATVSENATKNPLVFVLIMTHELSHVLLHSLLHPQSEWVSIRVNTARCWQAGDATSLTCRTTPQAARRSGG